ncbi:hypothetical protein ACVWXM_006398 [Bradyrhizobium sp. GM7.3]
MAIDITLKLAVECDDRGGDLLLDRRHALASDLEIRLGPFIDRAWREVGGNQHPLAVEFVLVERSRLFGRLQLRLLLTVGRLEGFDLEPRTAEARLGLVDGNLIRLRVDAKQHLPPPDALVVTHGYLDRLAGNARVDGHLGGTHKGVVGRDILLLRQIDECADHGHRHRQRKHQRPSQRLAEPCPKPLGGCVARAEAVANAEPAGDWREIETHRKILGFNLFNNARYKYCTPTRRSSPRP